ncbi:hypothetical protein [Streptomyces fructofermentans]|nr:hypothetical protein [Streptomyces fructofermentans]
MPLSARAALSLLTAAALTGCSTADGSPTAAEGKGPSASPTTRARPLTEAELRSLSLREADLPEVEPGRIAFEDRSDTSDAPSFKPASDPDCQTVHDIRYARAAPTVVRQVMTWKDGIFPGQVTLASYRGGVAERLFAELERAAGSCNTYRGDGRTGAYTSTMKTQKAPNAGDEAVQFREYSTVELGKRDELFIVVRTGSTIATYNSLEVGRVATFPTEPIIDQAERLRAAQDR